MVTAFAQYLQRSIHIGNKTRKWQKAEASADPGDCSSETEGRSNYKSRNLSKDSRKSMKLKVLTPVTNRLSKALKYNTYCFLESHLCITIEWQISLQVHSKVAHSNYGTNIGFYGSDSHIKVPPGF